MDKGWGWKLESKGIQIYHTSLAFRDISLMSTELTILSLVDYF